MQRMDLVISCNGQKSDLRREAWVPLAGVRVHKHKQSHNRRQGLTVKVRDTPVASKLLRVATKFLQVQLCNLCMDFSIPMEPIDFKSRNEIKVLEYTLLGMKVQIRHGALKLSAKVVSCFNWADPVVQLLLLKSSMVQIRHGALKLSAQVVSCSMHQMHVNIPPICSILPVWLYYLHNIWPLTKIKFAQSIIFYTKVGKIFCQTPNKPSNNCQSGEISPNLVTLSPSIKELHG